MEQKPYGIRVWFVCVWLLEASHFYTTEFSCVDDISLVILGTLEVKVILKLECRMGFYDYVYRLVFEK
jgi:hypothetical protein